MDFFPRAGDVEQETQSSLFPRQSTGDKLEIRTSLNKPSVLQVNKPEPFAPRSGFHTSLAQDSEGAAVHAACEGLANAMCQGRHDL